MRISTKCSVALHVLVVLVVFKDKKLTSEMLAESTGCNPVIIRNILGNLKKAGLVEVKRGTGGATLLVNPETVTIWTVFEAVDKSKLNKLIEFHSSPSSTCSVGKNIYDLLEKPYRIIGESVKESMKSYTLQQILDEYYSKQK